MALSDYISNILARHLPFMPSPDQEELFCRLGQFLHSSPADIMIVNGYAGTGKTSSMTALARASKELGLELVMLAPTGRSAKVLASYTGHSAFTIHKTIYRQKSSDPDSNSFSVRFERNINKHKSTLFIVDEASLISNSGGLSSLQFGSGRLLDDLIDFVRSSPGNKLLFLGDSAQLPPVGTKLSPALDPDYMSQYGPIETATLHRVLRQGAESGILYNATLLRLNIGRESAMMPQWKTDGFTDIHFIKSAELMECLNDAMERYGDEEVVVLCRSNKRANKYNQGIRGSILFREEALTKGDRLMVVKNCYHFTEGCPQMDFIANGDIARLMSIRGYETRYDLHFADAILSFPDYDHTEIRAKILLDTLLSETPALTEAESRKLFDGVRLDNSEIPNKKNRMKAMRDDPYLNAIQIKYAHAITCHKAQGGQWKAVFVEKAFFEDIQDIEQLRWYYTAFTRATEKLYLINFQ